MTSKFLRNDDDEDFQDFRTSPKKLGYTVRTIKLNEFRVKLDEYIVEPSYYSDIFDLMMDASEHDQINFFIASGGGRMDGLSVLLEGLRLTKAHTTAVLISDVHSSASIFALNCDDVIVTDSAHMLCHEVTYGYEGKGSDVYSHVAHIKKITEKVIIETYEGFLDQSEIERLLAGKQVYLDADQIRKCLEKRDAYFAAKEKKEETPAILEPVKTSRKKKAPVEA